VAIYHLSAKIISRGNGNSAVAAAAYRSADKLNNYRTNETYNYKRKQSVDYTEIFLPDNAPSEFYNREILWNSVEQNEKQKNAQLAREIEFALPNELNFEQQKNLAREFAMSFARQGMCVDLAFHDKKNNPHCHLLLTLRGLDEQGNWSPKCKKVNNRRVNFNNWNDKETLEKWRKDWEVMANLSLSEAGFKEQIDHIDVLSASEMTICFRDGRKIKHTWIQPKRMGKPWTEEQKAKFMESTKGLYTSERRKQMSEHMKLLRKERGKAWRKEK